MDAKPWYASRSMWFNIALSLAAIWPILAGFDWRTLLPPEYVPWMMLIVGVVGGYLRFITGKPIR